MIDSISSSSIYSSISNTSVNQQQNNSLSLDQQELIESTLSNYDSSSLSQSDAAEIVSAFQDAGIEPSKELADTMESLGFDAKEVGDAAGVAGGQGGGGGGMPPPPPPSEEEFDEVSTLIKSLFSTEDSDEDSDVASSFDDIMDYTSRILSLNDNSKDEVLDLFDKYNLDNSDLSSSEVNSVITSNLNQILGDSNNYKRVSFYA